MQPALDMDEHAPPAPAVDTRDALAYDRTHLANARTFAACLRTGLSVAAGGATPAPVAP